MKKHALIVIASLCYALSYSQIADENFELDSIEKTFTYSHGTIQLRNGIGSIVVPEGFKYLDATQSTRVIVDLWGNPPGPDVSLGMILPEHQRIMDGGGYAFNIQYNEIGYVKDDDAEDIDYEELLTNMKEETEAENQQRIQDGYEPISIVGWASQPFYDADRKILHWAKELKFGNSETNTLNYNVRVLGRKGVLVLNAISTTNELAMVKQDVPKVLDIVRFSDGYQYKDFDPSVDQVAAWTIGGLVAGKVLAKVGVLAVLAKFGKVIIFALIALFATFKNKIMNIFRRKKEVFIAPENLAITPVEGNKD